MKKRRSPQRRVRPRITLLGTLSVDTGDVVCFSSDSVLRILRALGKDVHDYEEFLKEFEAVPCQFAADSLYRVEKVTMVDSKGETCDAVVVGDGTPNFERFLLTNEPTFDEFLKRHPLSKQIGQGATFRPRILARIAREYRLKLGEKSFH